MTSTLIINHRTKDPFILMKLINPTINNEKLKETEPKNVNNMKEKTFFSFT